MQVVVGMSGKGMIRNKSGCHKHGRGCDDEHVEVMGHAFGECGVVWSKYTVHSLKKADQREIAGYIDR